ncbi:MAG: hypothetical protein HYT22_04135 [Candidatus Niyogibacteria bacterium]|nr:hypothetical protein [Candidatus Niyogibacteria bacterium]
MLFLIGILEMLVVTAWTKSVTKAQVVTSGLITVVNIFIWYYVLETIVNDIQNFTLILAYALGCALGTMIGTYYLGRRRTMRAMIRRVAQALRIKVAAY